MNLYLHGLSAVSAPIKVGIDALREPTGRQFTVVLTNPPFGTKGSLLGGGTSLDAGEEWLDEKTRSDFWVVTSNKQLNFLQHVFTILKPSGRCAIVVPDNVLFEGGAGAIIRRNLIERCHVHTLLRLPPGIFYAQGVKANVLFFDREIHVRRPGLWVYDLRTNKHFTLRKRRIQRADFDDFVRCYCPGHIEKRKPTWNEKNPNGRWRKFALEDLLARDRTNLDLMWIKDETSRSTSVGVSPQDLAAKIARDLRLALERFESVSTRLNR
jgi:type I restriction enzyme M protein